MVTVSKGVTVPSASMVSGMSPSATDATRTVCGGCPERSELARSLVEGAMFSNLCHATTAAAANATTSAILTNRLRRRGCSGGGASGVVGAARSAASGLKASFMLELT
jgi:hypothetical protein